MKTALRIVLKIAAFVGLFWGMLYIATGPHGEPWRMVCDRNGHYTFFQGDGTLWPFPFESHAGAQDMMDYLRSRESDRRIREHRFAAERKLARTAKWTPCEEPPAAKVEKAALVTPPTLANTAALLPLTHVEYSFVAIGSWLKVQSATADREWGVTVNQGATLTPENVRVKLTVEPIVAKTADGKWEITFKP